MAWAIVINDGALVAWRVIAKFAISALVSSGPASPLSRRVRLTYLGNAALEP